MTTPTLSLDMSDLPEGFKLFRRVDALQLIVQKGDGGQMMRAYRNRLHPDSVTFDAIPQDSYRYVVRLDEEEAAEACRQIGWLFGSYGGDGEDAGVVYFYHNITPAPYGDGGEPVTEKGVEMQIKGVVRCIRLGLTKRGTRYEARDMGDGIDLYHVQ